MSQKDFLHLNSEKFQTWVLVGIKCEFFFGNKAWLFFKIHYFGKFAIESVSKSVFTEDFSKSLEFGFFGKMDGFLFRKSAWKLSKTQNSNFCLDCVSTCIMAWEFSKFSKNRVFFWKNRWVVKEKILSFFKTALRGIFLSECVSDDEFAWKVSKQSIVGVFWNSF